MTPSRIWLSILVGLTGAFLMHTYLQAHQPPVLPHSGGSHTELSASAVWSPPATRPAPSVLDVIHQRESSDGQDERCWEVGPNSEYGEYQITDIFVADVKRISGYQIDRADNVSCRRGITIWLNYYAPRVGAETVAELYDLYRYGPSGYRALKGM